MKKWILIAVLVLIAGFLAFFYFSKSSSVVDVPEDEATLSVEEEQALDAEGLLVTDENSDSEGDEGEEEAEEEIA